MHERVEINLRHARPWRTHTTRGGWHGRHHLRRQQATTQTDDVKYSDTAASPPKPPVSACSSPQTASDRGVDSWYLFGQLLARYNAVDRVVAVDDDEMPQPEAAEERAHLGERELSTLPVRRSSARK